MLRLFKSFYFIVIIIGSVVVSSQVSVLSANPKLISTFLGGSGNEGWIYSGIIDAVIDGDGNIIFVGMTQSTDFPCSGLSYDNSFNGNWDICVVKMNSDLTILIAATYLGGSGLDQSPRISLGLNGEIYVVGATNSPNFPVTSGVIQGTYSSDGRDDCFIAKFDANLTTLLASTYLGKQGTEFSNKLVIDSNGDVFIGGMTESSSFPTTQGAYAEMYNGGVCDFYMTKINPDLTAIIASTYLGGSYQEKFPNMILDSNDDIIFAGATGSSDFPITTGAYDETFNGPPIYNYDENLDLCVSKISNDLSTLLASTYIGGQNFDGAMALTIDQNNNIFIGGHTTSINFPTTSGTVDNIHNGYNEYFITKVNPDLSLILASTYLTPGNNGFAFINELCVDKNGNIIGGAAGYDVLPTTSNAYDITFNGIEDVYIIKLDNNLSSNIIYASYFGTNQNEHCDVVVTDKYDNVFMVGRTDSPNFPTTPGVFNESINGGKDFFLAKLQFNCCFGMRGNIDSDSLDTIDISDLVFLVAYMFQSGAEPLCIDEANIDGDAENVIDISDLVALVAFMFQGGSQPVDCI